MTTPDWNPQQLARVLNAQGFNVAAKYDEDGNVQVTIGLNELLRFAEEWCGFMGEFDLTGNAFEPLGHEEQLLRLNHEFLKALEERQRRRR